MPIRMASVHDAAEILVIYASYCSTPITFELQPPTLVEMEQRIRGTLKQYPWLVMVEGDRVLGYAYAHVFRDRPAYRWSVETSLYVAQDAHRRGVGTNLYTKLLSLLKAQGFVSVLGGITLPNPASERLHERFGFKPVGRYKNVGYKCDAWHDVGFYELELNTPSPAPRKPLGLDAVAGMLVTPCA